MNPKIKELCLSLFLLFSVSLVAVFPAGAQEDLCWLEPGEPVPEQFAFSGEPPALEEVNEAFLKAFGGEPSLWPEELRNIHEVQVAFNKRALASSKFKGQFSQEALAKMRAQEKDPVGYWSRCLHEGWGFEEWFNHDHLTVQRVPRALLDRFMTEVFPLTWRDIRSIVHVQEYMLELSDEQFIPYNDYDSRVLDLRKRDVQEYNSLVEDAAEGYIKGNDFLMLLLMPERIDTNWVGDEAFEASLVKQAKRLSEKVQDVVSDMDRRFRSAFYRAFPKLTYSWNAEPWSEDHVVFNGKPVQRGPSIDLLGTSTRIEHPYIGEKITIQEQKVTSGPTLKLQWGTVPSHSSEFDKGAVVEKVSPRYMVARKQYGESREFILSLYLDHLSGFGHEVSFGPAGASPFPEEIGAEIMEAITEAFLEAAEVLYSGPVVMTAKDLSSAEGLILQPGEQKGEANKARKVTLDPPTVNDMHVDHDLPEGWSFSVVVWEDGRPVPQARVAIRKPEAGVLSSRTAEGGDEKWLLLRTGPLGEAVINYTPPSLTELKMMGPSQWQVNIVAEDQESGAKASVTFRITRPLGLDVAVEHPVLPADPGFQNTLRLRFDGRNPQGDRDEKFRVKITVKSGNGALSQDPEGYGGKSAFAMEVESDVDHVLYYRWFGPRDLDGPVTETVLFQVPELELEGTASFLVGVAPSIHSTQQEQLGVEQPGLFVPLKVYVQDEYHPDLDMAEFFRSFQLKPVLDISQVGFKPIDPDDSLSRQILEALLGHLKGAELPRDAVPLEPETWSLARDAGSRWFLVGGVTPAGSAPRNAFPGIILWDYGDYTFRISMNLEDAHGLPVEPLKRTMTKILHVRPFPTGDKRAELILPMILAYSAMFPGEEARQFSVRSRNLLQRGDLATASVTIGEYFSKRLSSVSPDSDIDLHDMERLEYLVHKAHGVSGAPLSETILEGSLSQAKLNFLCAAAGEYAEIFLSQGYDLSKLVDPPSLDRSSPELEILEMIKGFLEGYGGYGILALARENIKSLEIYSESGEELSEFHGQVFGGGGGPRRVFFGKNSVVVPFLLGENLLINLRGKGKPVDAIKILPNGINVQRYGFHPGSETINVYGDVVRP
ncbi:MAG: hypothetical protein WCS47_04240 [Thermovirgaceae bacterium]|nr:hypothetical protein [Synergistales bacterium]MDI9392383.1 hypothetical protein [Synergistota bacterium]NLV65133.1 hypothetical protein [Synergistaceae bacterium]HRW87168.1 hypothetical protein [Thermovirgaceae bacterium]MDD5514749.1 hypothetical protein [Synergistales bacterium]